MTTESTAPSASRGNEELLDAVKSLTDEVKALSKILARDYPKREEVQSDARDRAGRFLALFLAIIVIAQLITVSTISYCFLPQHGYPRACNAIPGYSEAIDRSGKQLQIFSDMTAETSKNRKRIEDLEREVNQLKNDGK